MVPRKKVKNMKSAIAVQIMKSRSQNDLILMKRRSCALHKLNMKEASVYLSRRNRQSLRRKGSLCDGGRIAG